MRKVCSHWALGFSSPVITSQPYSSSASMNTFHVPMLIMGSMVNTMPGTSRQHVRASVAEVHHLGLLVELKPHAVAAQVAHHPVVVFLGVLLYGVAYVAHEAVRLGGLGPYLEALPGHPYELLLLGCCLSDDIHA